MFVGLKQYDFSHVDCSQGDFQKQKVSVMVRLNTGIEITTAHYWLARMKKPERGDYSLAPQHHQQHHHETHIYTPTHTCWPWPKVLSIRQGTLPTLGWTLTFSWQDTSLEQLLRLLQDKSARWLIIKGPHRCCFTLTLTLTTTVFPLSAQAAGSKFAVSF